MRDHIRRKSQIAIQKYEVSPMRRAILAEILFHVNQSSRRLEKNYEID